MPSIKDVRLADAIVQAGPTLQDLDGFGEDMVSIEPQGDVGSALAGAKGDGMFVGRVVTLYTVTFTFLQASDGVTRLLQLNAANAAFKFNFKFGDFSIFGFMKMQTIGPWQAGLGTLTRTMVANLFKVSGNTEVSIGASLDVG